MVAALLLTQPPVVRDAADALVDRIVAAMTPDVAGGEELEQRTPVRGEKDRRERDRARAGQKR